MKRENNRQEMMRRMIGAILASGLSSQDIYSLSEEMISDSAFSYEIGRLLRRHLELAGIDPPQRASGIDSNDPGWLASAIELVGRRGLTKKELVSIIQKQVSLPIPATTLQRLTVREILLRVFENASSAKSSSFLKSLGEKMEPDMYLKGIEQR